jgi:hypothetical protein
MASRQSGEFSVSYPSVDQAVLADYCGLVHGYEEDKTEHLEIFSGALPSARGAAVSCELSAAWKVNGELPHDFFLHPRWRTSTQARASHRRQGRPVKLRPFALNAGQFLLGLRPRRRGLGDRQTLLKS